MTNLLAEADLQEYQPESPTGICLRILSSTVTQLGEKLRDELSEVSKVLIKVLQSNPLSVVVLSGLFDLNNIVK